MRIAIIGAGKVGTALGRGWGSKGDTIVFGVRQLDHPRLQAIVAEAGADARAALNGEAAQAAQVIVLCTPWPETQAAIIELGDIAGKLLIDCTNPLLPGFAGLAMGTTTSAGEQVAAWTPGAKVVKALRSA